MRGDKLTGVTGICLGDDIRGEGADGVDGDSVGGMGSELGHDRKRGRRGERGMQQIAIYISRGARFARLA